MAIRERKGRARPFQCYWNNPITGKRESESFATREEAEKKDSMIKHRLRFERESFGQGQDKGGKKEFTFERAFLLYLREKNFSRKTVEWQLYIMRCPLRMLGIKPVSAVSASDIADVLDRIRASGVKPTTVKAYQGGLKAFFQWLVDAGICDEMPKFPKPPKATHERFIPPTRVELAHIMSAAPRHIQRVVIIGAQLGARVGPSELFKLQWSDVDLTQGVLRIRAAKKNPNAPWREVPIRESLIPVMAQWAMEDKAVGVDWIIHFRGNPVTTIKRAWSATLRRAGITRRIRPYDLRHAFATELIAAGADIGTVAKLMGHSGPAMILNHYQYVMDKQKRAAIESLPEFQYVPSDVPGTKKGSRHSSQALEISGRDERI